MRPPSALSARIPWRKFVVAPEFTCEAQYDVMVEPPRELLSAEGQYRTGWFSHEPEVLNTTISQAGWRRLHRWFFVHFDTPDYFVGANIADLRLGGNVGIIVLDKRTGEFTVAEETQLLLNNKVLISDDCRSFMEPSSGSYMRALEDDNGSPTGAVEFGLFIGETQLVGVAEPMFTRPLVQSTRLGAELGTFQVWGNLALRSATLTLRDQVVELPAGSPGAFDRSLGHRRFIENWNWIAACGEVTSSDATVPFALHAAVDRASARPRVNAHKAVLWVGDAMVKVSDLGFDYLGPGPESGPWAIRSDTQADSWVQLTFEPSFHRRDAKRIPLVLNVDHSQFFGHLHGEVCADGVVYNVSEVFATAEDSLMVV